jgi:hypothetical protein
MRADVETQLSARHRGRLEAHQRCEGRSSGPVMARYPHIETNPKFRAVELAA